MGVGEFLSDRVEDEVHRAQIRDEVRSIRENPDYELAEMAVLLENEGLCPADALSVAGKLREIPASFQRTMVQKELGLNPERDPVRVAEAVTMAISYFVSSLVPLTPYFVLPIREAFGVSMALTLLVLVLIGLVRGKMGRLPLIRSVLEVLIVGTASGVGGYLLGTAIPRHLGA
jgi:VIT1/CCC1 family predicted Fe2+/Mn2+ transporter